MSLLSARFLSVSFAGSLVLDDVGVVAGDGERLGLVGQNGAGKTTLLRLLAGRLRPDAGTVRRQGSLGYLELEPELSDGATAVALSDGSAADSPNGGTIADAVDVALAELRSLEGRLRQLEDAMARGQDVMDEYGDALAEFEARDGWSAAARARWEQAYVVWTDEVNNLQTVVRRTARTVGHDNRAPRDNDKFAPHYFGHRVDAAVARRVRDAEVRLARLRERRVPKPAKPLRLSCALGTDGKGGVLIAVRDLYVPGRVRCAALDITAESRRLVTGPNGAGKSSLLAALAGSLEPSRGRVMSTRGLRVGWLPQVTTFPDPSASALKSVRRRTSWAAGGTPGVARRARTALRRRPPDTGRPAVGRAAAPARTRPPPDVGPARAAARRADEPPVVVPGRGAGGSSDVVPARGRPRLARPVAPPPLDRCSSRTDAGVVVEIVDRPEDDQHTIVIVESTAGAGACGGRCPHTTGYGHRR